MKNIGGKHFLKPFCKNTENRIPKQKSLEVSWKVVIIAEV